MTGPIVFTLPEVIDLIQARDAATEENRRLHEEVGRLRAENEVLREQVREYWQDRRKARILPADRNRLVG